MQRPHIANANWTLDASAFEQKLAYACQFAYLKDIAIVASEDNHLGRRSLPAELSTINGVRSNDAVILRGTYRSLLAQPHSVWSIRYDDRLIAKANSFAAAKPTRIATLVLSAFPSLHPYELKSAIVHLARSCSANQMKRQSTEPTARKLTSTYKSRRRH